MESHLKDKSDLSKNAAEFLSKSGHPLSVVHCAYYSCFQFLSYFFKKKYNRDLKLEYGLYRKNNESEAGSHQFAIGLMRSDISRRLGSPAAKNFANSMEALLKLRHEADYADVCVNQDYGRNSLDLMNLVMSELKK